MPATKTHEELRDLKNGRFTAPPDGRPATVSFPPKAWLLLIVFGLLMLALLGGQLVFIVQQRQIVDDQREIARIQEDRARPVLQDARPLMDAARDALGPLSTGASRADRLVRSLRDNDAPAAIAAAGVLARQLSRSGAAGDLDRLPRLATNLVDLQRRAYTTNRRSLATTRRSLATQQRTLALIEESLAIQRELLAHTRNIDRKTGGGTTGASPIP